MAFYRRNLPHGHPEGRAIFLTWRLYGSLPAAVMRAARTARNGCATEDEDSPGKRFKLLDETLDSANFGQRIKGRPPAIRDAPTGSRRESGSSIGVNAKRK